jgi:hypothetical protein
MQREAFRPAQGDRGKTQLHISHIISGSVLYRFMSDAVDCIRRTIEQPQGIELRQKVLKREFIFFLDLDQSTQSQNIGRDSNTMLASNVHHGVQSKGPFQVAM